MCFCDIATVRRGCFCGLMIWFIYFRNTWTWDVTCGLFGPSRRNVQPNWWTGCWKWLVPLGNRKTVSGIRNWDGGCCCQAYSLWINVRLYPLGRCCHWLPLPLKLGNVASQVRLLSVLTVWQHAISFLIPNIHLFKLWFLRFIVFCGHHRGHTDSSIGTVLWKVLIRRPESHFCWFPRAISYTPLQKEVRQE